MLTLPLLDVFDLQQEVGVRSGLGGEVEHDGGGDQPLDGHRCNVVTVLAGDPVVGGVEVRAGVLASAEVVPVPRRSALVVAADLVELEALRLAELGRELDDRRVRGQRRGEVDHLDPARGDGGDEVGERGHAANDDRRGWRCHPSRCHPRQRRVRLSGHDCGDRDRRSVQGVPALASGAQGRRAGARPVRAGGWGVRLPRSQRVGEDDHDPLPAGLGVGDGRPGCRARATVTARALGGDAADRCDRRDAGVVPDDDRPGEPRVARRHRPDRAAPGRAESGRPSASPSGPTRRSTSTPSGCANGSGWLRPC